MFETAVLRKKYPYLEFFYSVFSRIRTEYEEILCFSPYSVQMRESGQEKLQIEALFTHSWFSSLQDIFEKAKIGNSESFLSSQTVEKTYNLHFDLVFISYCS